MNKKRLAFLLVILFVVIVAIVFAFWQFAHTKTQIEYAPGDVKKLHSPLPYTATNSAIIKITQEEQPNNLQDAIQTVIIPVLLALLGTFFTITQQETSQKLSEEQARNQSLQNYIKELASLLPRLKPPKDKKKPKRQKKQQYTGKKKDAAAWSVAKALTVMVLNQLDPERKRHIVQFLYDAGLVSETHHPLFSGANLTGMDLSKIIFSDGKLVLFGAILARVIIPDDKRDLAKIDFDGTDMSGINLSRMDLSRTDLSYATLPKTTSRQKLNLTSVKLSAITLSQMKLPGSNLSGADLSGEDLSGLDFSGADLSYANLSKTLLTDTIFYKTNLSYTNFTGATGLTKEQLADAITTDNPPPIYPIIR